MKSLDGFEDCNLICVLDFVVTERLNNCCNKEEIKVGTFEELEEEDAAAAYIAWSGEK